MKTSLGTLERQVMDIVWKSETCTTRYIFIKLNKEKKLAYTTVATILARLYTKGLLSRNLSSTGYVYKAKVSKNGFSKHIANDFLKKFIGNFGDSAIASFAESIDKLPEEKRKYFLKILKEYGDSK